MHAIKVQICKMYIPIRPKSISKVYRVKKEAKEYLNECRQVQIQIKVFQILKLIYHLYSALTTKFS
jgi:hypothetical protein